MSNKVLLIVIDQFRADCLKGPLADIAPLPNLQSLKAEATTFLQHYTVTTPCGPSRASLLTGLYAMNHRSVRNGTPLGKQHLTIGHHMRHHGYEPLLFGYTDTSVDPTGVHPNDPDLKNYEGLAPGFSEIVRLRFEKPNSWLGYLKSKGYELPENYWDLYQAALDKTTASIQYPDGSPIRSPARYSAEDSDTAYLTNRTLEELSALESSDWFAMLTYLRPHPPLVAPKPFNTYFTPETMPAAVRGNTLESLRESHPFFNTYFSDPSNHAPFMGCDDELATLTDYQVSELRAVYLGLAQEVDQHIGRVIDFLKTTKQYDNTLILITADHGEMLGDQWMWGKNAPYDAALHIPLIIRDPRNSESFGKEVSSFTESIDIAPTLLDWVGNSQKMNTDTNFDGYSLLPLLEGRAPANWRDHVFAEAELGQPDKQTHYQSTLNLTSAQANYAVLRSNNAKYVHFNGGLPPMFFNLHDDPNELQNIAGDPKNRDDLQYYASRMLDHRMTNAYHALSNSKLTEQGLFHGN